LQPEIWLHEAGIASNRSSARCGEFTSIQVQTARQAAEVGRGGNWRDLYVASSMSFDILKFKSFFRLFL